MHVQQEVPESEQQRRLPGIIPAVALSPRCHSCVLFGFEVRGEKGNYPPQAGLHVHANELSRPGEPSGGGGGGGGSGGAPARTSATGLRQHPQCRGSS